MAASFGELLGILGVDHALSATVAAYETRTPAS